MELTFRIGSSSQSVNLNESQLLGVLQPNEISILQSEESVVKDALVSPIGTPPLSELVGPGDTVSIITSDITRPMPTWAVMPYILDELYKGGVTPKDITLVFALGSHRPHTIEEKIHLAGMRAWNEITCTDLNVNDCVLVGTTSRGTPVEIDRRVIEADHRICLGNIEYHYFAGYSGGAKAIMPGVSTKAAIQANHSHMSHPDACTGKLVGNPVREDMEEAAAIVGVDFIFNVVLDANKNIVKAFAGDVTQAHRAGCKFLDSLYCKQISEPADIVIVSQGGAPKDLNLYQTQKALDNAKHAVKQGGIIILIGSCIEGLGESVFEEWMMHAQTPDALIDRIQKEFQLGGHKAAAIAKVLKKSQIYLVSDMDESLVHKLFMHPFHTVQEAYDAALQICGSEAKILAMPFGGSTLPQIYK